MLTEVSAQRVYLACGATDLRKSIDGLAGLVQTAFALDPCSDAWFVFCNKDRDKLKLLRWDNNGFWLYYRRLEQGRFAWPKQSHGVTQSVSRRELMWLLDGLSLEQKRAHPTLSGRRVV